MIYENIPEELKLKGFSAYGNTSRTMEKNQLNHHTVQGLVKK